MRAVTTICSRAHLFTQELQLLPLLLSACQVSAQLSRVCICCGLALPGSLQLLQQLLLVGGELLLRLG
jgi:hypothetical protein